MLATDALDVADTHLEDALAQARARGSIPGSRVPRNLRGWVSLRRGAVGKAECEARTSLELLTSHGISLGVPYAVALIGSARNRATWIRPSASCAPTGSTRESGPGPLYKVLSEVRGLLRIAEGRTREGLDELLRLAEPDDDWGSYLLRDGARTRRWRS